MIFHFGDTNISNTIFSPFISKRIWEKSIHSLLLLLTNFHSTSNRTGKNILTILELDIKNESYKAKTKMLVEM